MKALAFPTAGLLAVFVLWPLFGLTQAAEYSSEPQELWTATGRVTTPEGKPFPGVEIWVHAGMGSLKRVAVTKTDADGRYTVPFGRGVHMPVTESNLQIANVTAHLPGYFEKNLNRHGARAAALREVGAEELKTYGITPEQLFLPGKPQTIDFVIAPAARITGKLLGTGSFRRLPPQAYRRNGESEQLVAGYVQNNRSPLAKWRVWLTGKELPPACGVLASAETDEQGTFVFDSVPVGFEWQLMVETHDPRVEPKSPPFRVEKAGDQTVELELLEESKELRLKQ